MLKRLYAALKAFSATTWFDLAIVFLVGLLPLTWFRGSLIAGWDLPWPICDPAYVARTATSAWNPALCLGAPDIYVRALPYFVGSMFLGKLGLSSLTVEKLWFIFWFAGGGLSMYFLIRVLVPGRRLAAVSGALFYMLNPFTMMVRWHEMNLWLFYYALVPLLLALFALSIRSGRKGYVAAFLAAAVLISPGHVNLGSVVMLALVLGGYLVTYLVQNRRARDKVKRALLYTLVMAVLWLGISAWWILPSLASLRHEAGILKEPGSTTDILTWTSSESAWHRVLRLRGYWAFRAVNAGTDEPVIPYAREYANTFMDLLSWMIPALGIAGLCKIKRYRGLVWPAVLWVGSVFFMKGVRPPLGGFTKALFSVLPGMSIFRNPFDKFGMLALLGLAPLVGVGLESLHGLAASLLDRRTRKGLAAGVTAAVLILLLGVLVWPFWTGDVIDRGGPLMPSFRMKEVPADYEQAASWLEEQGDGFRILPLPYNRGFWSLALFDWYQGHDLSRWLLKGNTATPSFGFTGKELPEFAAYEVANAREYGRTLCDLLNVKYVLLREDANWEVLPEYDYSMAIGYIARFLPELREALDGQEWLEPAARFGNLVFYLNRDWRPRAAQALGDFREVDLRMQNVLDIGEMGPGAEAEAETEAEQVEAEPWHPIGKVDWSEDEQGVLKVTSLTDQDLEWVGLERNISLGEGLFAYSYQLRTENTLQAHLKVEWYGKDGQMLDFQKLQEGLDGSNDWTTFSGPLLRPRDAAKAKLILFMHPKENALMEVKDFSIEKKRSFQALGKVSWSEDQEGVVSVTSLSDEDREWVGVQCPMQLGEGPFSYSFQVKAENASHAHLKVEWYDGEGKLVGSQPLMSGLYGTKEWSPRMGTFERPPGAVSANILLIMQPRKDSTVQLRDLVIEEGFLIQPFGQVSWGKDERGVISVTSLSDEDLEWVGIRFPVQLGEGPFIYSYQSRSENASCAHLKLEWLDEEGKVIDSRLLEPGLSGDTDWTERSGFLLKPPEAKSADLVLLMEPRQGARMEVKDLFLGEQSWIKALCSEASGEGTDKASSQEDRVLLSADDARMLGLPPGEAPGLELSRPVLTLEDSRPWSAKVKVKTDGPCFLVLNQAYDAGWQAYRGSPGWLKALTSSGDLQASHLMVNGYANAWFIKEAGEYEVTLYYRPQTLLYLGVIISAVVWALFAAWCVLAWRKSRQKRSS
jgi:hypothetical protein